MRNLEILLAKVLEMCDNAGIPYRKIDSIKYNNRFSRHWGCCYRNTINDNVHFRIEISGKLGKEDFFPDESAIIQTIMHEVIHTCVDCFDHGQMFQYYGGIAREKYGIDITRTTSAKSKNADIAFYMSYKYVLKCESCGNLIYMGRSCDLTAHPEHYKCAKCGGKIIRIK